MSRTTVQKDAGEITIEHLTTSLARVEDWCRAVRQALESLPDKEAIRFPAMDGSEPVLARKPQAVGVCPPPEPDPNHKPGACPPPDAEVN